jgi:dienelactone hydrolase
MRIGDRIAQMGRPVLAAIWLAIITAALAPNLAVAEERVKLMVEGQPPIEAVLGKPRGAGPFPAIIALHGCGGLFNRKGELSARHQDWLDRLVDAGFVVLFPDSLGSRGLTSQCETRKREVTAALRAQDAVGAADWLARQAFVDRNRIGLLGWSHGGSTALRAVWRVRPQTVDFKQAAIFYPGCTSLVGSGWTPRMPVTLFHGMADDWTPIGPCEDLARAGGAALIAYPNAYHGFDAPNARIRERHAAYTTRSDGLVTTGTNGPARADSIQRAMSLFEAMH